MSRIQFWYGVRQAFAAGGLPQRWINVLGRVARPQDCAELAYSLNGGEFVPLSVGPDKRRLAGIGDFNVEIDHADLHPGENDLVLRWRGLDGETKEAGVTVVNEGQACAELPLHVDWGTSLCPPGVQVVDGLWRFGDGMAVPQEIAYDRVLALGDMEWQDYKVSVPVTIYGINAACYERPSNGYAVGVVVRWQGHHDRGPDDYCSGQPRYGWYPAGAFGVLSGRHEGPQHMLLNSYDGMKALAGHDFGEGESLRFGVPYMLSLRVESRAGRTSRYTFQLRLEHDEKKLLWKLEADGEEGELDRGAVVLFSHHVACAFGPVTVEPVG